MTGIQLINRQLEKQAIKAITAGKAHSSWLLGALSAEHFGRQELRETFKRIRKLAGDDSEIPSWDDLLHDPKLSGAARESLSSFKSKVTPTKERCKAIRRSMETYRIRRVLYTGVQQAAEQFEKPDVDEEAVQKLLADSIAESRSRNSTLRTYTTGEGNNSKKLVSQILSGTALHAIPTGFKAFDLKNRGIFVGSLFVLGATTGGGKTAVALQLASNMAEAGAKVGIISLEMGEEEVMVRNLARYSRTSLSKLIDPESMTDQEKNKVKAAYTKRVELLKRRGASETIHVPSEDLTLEELLYSVHGYGYDVIFIDYISLLKDAGGDDQWQKLGEIARFAKVFARNNKCIVVLLAQVNQDGIIRYSRAVEEHANNAWYWVRDAKAMELHILNFIQKKARNQSMFPFAMQEEFEYMSVRDLDEATAKKLEAYKVRGDDKKKGKGHNSDGGGMEAPRSRASGSNDKYRQKKKEPSYSKKEVDEDSYFSDDDD